MKVLRKKGLEDTVHVMVVKVSERTKRIAITLLNYRKIGKKYQ